MTRTVAILQARLSSSRFPGKVLQSLADMPMILFMVQRVLRATTLDALVVATSAEPSDDPLAAVLSAQGIACFRGSLTDVLGRFHGAAMQAGASHVVRLTGDCPLMDPTVIDAVVQRLHASGAAYVSNVAPPTFPDGLDVEAMTMAALSSAHQEAVAVSDREHVTPFLRNQPQRFPAASVRACVDFSPLRWTVDYPDDLAFVRALLDRCSTDPLTADRFDFYRVLERHPELLEINRHDRNEGYAPADTLLS